MTKAIGSVAGGLLGGAMGGKAASLPNYYGNAMENNKNYQSLVNNQMSNINQLQNTAIPAAFNNYNTAANNPYAAQFQQGANTAGQAYTDAGNAAFGYGQSVGSQIDPMVSYASQIMNMGLDPQRNMYNQQRQGAMDVGNATNAAYGISGPWAAGNTGQQVQNFENDWQNNQLSRAIQALSAGGGAINNAGNAAQTAGNLMTGGANSMYMGAGLPYNAAQGMSSNQTMNLNDLINSVGGVNNIDSNTMASLLQYLSGATGSSQANMQSQMAGSAAGASGGSQIASAAMSALPLLFSDERLKENIEPEGEENGFPIYSFNYIWDKATRFVGVLAQDIIDLLPEAVTNHFGLYKVNYAMIGVTMRRA